MPFWNKPREETTTPAPLGIPEQSESPPQPPTQEPQPMAMLKRDDAPGAGAPNDLNALLGVGSEFEGKLTFEGSVRIDGKLTGSIMTSDTLIVGETAKLAAEVTCGSIVVHGEVTGNIRAKVSVELRQPARVRGNIETPSLMIERGVMYEGQTTMDAAAVDKAVPGRNPNVPPPLSAVSS